METKECIETIKIDVLAQLNSLRQNNDINWDCYNPEN